MEPERWKKIQEIYEAAVEHGITGATAFVERACSGDDELRREVESLLARDKEAERFLEVPAIELTAMTLFPAPGAHVATYRIESLLGRGGVGSVYSAFDTKLQRRVAVKFLSDELAVTSSYLRFQREAQMASSLNHPHIVTVHDVGESEGRQFIVTELVDGGTLNDWARAEKRTWPQIVELLIGVADGLASAHEANIVHRDIKPANILVARNGYAKLADFGLAKLAENADVDLTRSLTEGRVLRPG
jgi:serine/threonine-protein kinase